jgi:hypothetical protein
VTASVRVMRETASVLGALGSRAAARGRMWGKPATYVISERDAILPADVAERVAALAGHDRFLMLSRPAGLALILAGIVARTALAEPATS